MGFLQNIANLEMDYYDTIAQRKRDRELGFVAQDRLQQEALAQEALQKVQALERQKQLAADYEQDPLQPGMHGVRPEFDFGDKLKQYQAYGQAGIDPAKMAQNQTAQLAAQAFAEAIPNVKTDVGKINIGMGKEYKPNVYRKNKAEADDAELRLKTLEDFFETPELNKLIAVDAAQKKQVFNPEKVTIEGNDGKAVQGMATPTLSGKYIGKTIDDITGKPLAIPVEAGEMTSDMKNTKYYSKLWNKTEAETAKILKSKATDTPEEFWSKTVTANSSNSFGAVEPYDMLKQSMFIWATAKQGEPLPRDIAKTIKTYDLNPDQETEILELASLINDNVEALPVVAETPTAAPGLNKPFYQIPGLSAGAGRGAGLANVPQQAAATARQPQIQQQKPPDFNAVTKIAMQYDNPADTRKALQEQGVDYPDAQWARMIIDIINSGDASPEDGKYLAELLGIPLDTSL